MQECPSVRFGTPRQTAHYLERSIHGVTVFVPHTMRDDLELTVSLQRLFFLKRLVLDGWRVL